MEIIFLIIYNGLNNINNENININKNVGIFQNSNKNMLISNSSQKSIKNSKKYEINNAIDILLDNKSNKEDLNNYYGDKLDQNSLELNSHKNISSRDISHDLAYINNNKIEPFNSKNNSIYK